MASENNTSVLDPVKGTEKFFHGVLVELLAFSGMVVKRISGQIWLSKLNEFQCKE